MPQIAVRNAEIIEMTGKMTGKIHAIRGKRGVRMQERPKKNARKQTTKVEGNVGGKSEMPRTIHATLPGT